MWISFSAVSLLGAAPALQEQRPAISSQLGDEDLAGWLVGSQSFLRCHPRAFLILQSFPWVPCLWSGVEGTYRFPSGSSSYKEIWSQQTGLHWHMLLSLSVFLPNRAQSLTLCLASSSGGPRAWRCDHSAYSWPEINIKWINAEEGIPTTQGMTVQLTRRLFF